MMPAPTTWQALVTRFRGEDRADRYQSESNRYAELALSCGCAGASVAARRLAWLADQFAEIAAAARRADVGERA